MLGCCIKLVSDLEHPQAHARQMLFCITCILAFSVLFICIGFNHTAATAAVKGFQDCPAICPARQMLAHC